MHVTYFIAVVWNCTCNVSKSCLYLGEAVPAGTMARGRSVSLRKGSRPAREEVQGMSSGSHGEPEGVGDQCRVLSKKSELVSFIG